MTITITIQREPLSASFPVGSIGEALAILTEHKEKWVELCDLATDFRNSGEDSTAISTGTVQQPAAETGRKGRGKGKNQPDPATASAPTPMPTPEAAAPPAPAPTAPGQAPMPDIPPAFDRRGEAPAAAAPPAPPPMPSAPPVAPAAPPTPPAGVLGQKIAAELEKRAVGTADNGRALAEWAAHPGFGGLYLESASFEEAMAAIRMTGDDRLSALAGALSITA